MVTYVLQRNSNLNGTVHSNMPRDSSSTLFAESAYVKHPISLGSVLNEVTGAFTILSLLCVGFVYLRKYSLHQKLPPGPAASWIYGNKRQLPSSKPWKKFKEWTDLYGSVITFWNGQRPTVVIGDPKVANDLLDKRSAIYSSRPRFVVMGELFTNNDALLTMPYGKKWKDNRKLFYFGLLRSACETYRPIQLAESQRLVRDLLNDSANFMGHIERYAASVMVCVAYGSRVDALDDSVVRRVYERMGYMATLNVPGAYWAEAFPILKHIPDFLAPWKREVKRRGAEGTQLLLDLALSVKGRMDNPNENVPPCFSKTLWERYDKHPDTITEREIAYATGSLFGAGADTTASTIQSFALAMTCFPHVAEKAREELDRVVGITRSPTWEDMPHLPYCNAIIKETLRWRPVAVLGGTPHATTRDDFYEGHFIPKGTTIMGNLWAIHHNPAYFHDSHNFIPERYLEDQGTLPYPHRDGHSAFGWGRRICPGKLLAENSLYITIVRMLWGLKFSKDIDPISGSIIEPDIYDYTDGFNSKPRPFSCRIQARNETIAEVIRKEALEGEDFLKAYKPRGT